jgi:hypothetical protein
MSIAAVPTEASDRYAKQLLAHLGRKNPVEPVEGSPDADRLVLEADAPDEESLTRVQDVLGRHLERFGARRDLTVHWSA